MEGFDHENKPHAMPPIPYDGVPFMHVSSLIKGCEYASIKGRTKLQSKEIDEYRRKVKAGEIIHQEELLPTVPGPLLPDLEQDVSMAAHTLEMMQVQHSRIHMQYCDKVTCFGAGVQSKITTRHTVV